MDDFEIKKARDFGSLITDSFVYVRHHFKSLGKSILFFVVPFIALSSFFTYHYLAKIQSLAANDVAQPLNFHWHILSNSMIINAFMGLLTISALATVVLNHLKLVADPSVDNKNIGTEHIWQSIKKDFPVVILLMIGVYIASMFGILLFIIGVFFVSIKLIFVPAAYILEEKSITASFSRSWSLIKNYWWETFALIIVMSLLLMVIVAGVTIPFVIISAFTNLSGFLQPGSNFYIINNVIGSITNVLYGLIYVCLGLHFFNLKERKGGENLGQRIENIA